MKTNGIPWNDYPRPRLVREDWLCLNGAWDFDRGHGPEKIRVPFCPESALSGIHGPTPVGTPLTYRRTFTVPDTWRGRRVLLHLGAVSRRVEVLLNGTPVTAHGNGYLPFTADLTDGLLPGENVLTVRAVNDLDHRHPWGKQKEKRGGMWYTPVSGIWQTVWLEPVPETYIRSLTVTTGPDWAEVRTEGAETGLVRFRGQDYPLHRGVARLPVPEPVLWSPENPHLYPFTVICGEDRVESYFALRTLTVERVNGKMRLCLNGEPFFFHGLLDQGYWRDGLYTPPTPEGYAEDIRAMKALGFNTLRKHIKVEPERFYYDCDRLGMVVFQDMVNCGDYSFLHDTVLPTLGLTRLGDRWRHRDPETRKNFLEAMDETVDLLAGHPCICLWTIFNEGWGQFCADEAYERLRARDGTRFIDAASGWFRQEKSDVESLHIYFRRLKLGRQDRPQLLSEFGGYAWKLEDHCFDPKKTYGYRKFTDRESFVRGLRALLEELVPLAEQGLCGSIYTQVSDVEDETNGLLTWDREVQKVEPEELADIAGRLRAAVKR